MTERTTIVGVFQDRAHAQQAINELKRVGFRDDEIGVTSREERARTTDADDEADESFAPEGGLAGLAAGAGVGALWGLGILSGVLPGIGPAIAGGTLAAILSSAAAGAAAAGLAGMLIGLGIPKEEAEYYESEFRSGRTIVTVKTKSRQGEALAILRRHGGYDMSTRDTALEGKAPMAATSSKSALHENEACPPGMATSGMHTHTGAGQTFQAREEQLNVQKHKERAGDVRVRKEVHTEHKSIDVPVEREEVVVERHPVSGQRAASGPIGAGEEIRVPITEEHVEVTKTPVVKEEVSVGKRKVQGTEHVQGTVRKEEIKVENEGQANVRERRK